MREFTAGRDENTPDEIWLLQHPPTFTQGRNGKAEHLLNPGEVPLIQIDRGGQVTYHGPGQLVVYLLLDLRRMKIGVRHLVSAMEQAVVELLAGYGISATTRPDAPGVYVDNAKIAALGLRVKRSCSYHGLSLNVDMDLAPFELINPCGYPGMAVTDLRSLGINDSMELLGNRLAERLQQKLLHTP
jgi:lipoyl(octanoyl) transferase